MNVRKKIALWPFVKFQTTMGAVIGMLLGTLYSVGGLIVDAMVSGGLLSPQAMSTPGLSYGTLLAFGALIGMPLIFAVFGFALGVVEVMLYTLGSKWLSGIDLDFRPQ